MEVVARSLRGEKAGVRGREWIPYRDGSLESESTQGTEGLGEGAQRNRGKKNTTLLASMSLSGMGEAMCLEDATDAEAFEVYVEHFLAPSLKKGQVVVFDNLGAHKAQKVRELIEARGAQVLFVPSYSPELNPIEEAFSKIKAIIRKALGRVLGRHCSKR